MEEMNHTVTVFDVEGAYTNTKKGNTTNSNSK